MKFATLDFFRTASIVTAFSGALMITTLFLLHLATPPKTAPVKTAPVKIVPKLSQPEKLQTNTVVLTDIRGHGSGVLFTRDKTTFIWTAAHVADNWQREDGTFRLVTVVQGDYQVKAEVLRCGDDKAGVDVALLRVVEMYFFQPICRYGDTEFYRDKVYVGQKVIHCGSPLDPKANERLISYGHISGVKKTLESWPLIVPKELDRVNIIAYPGCSGGPVIDAETGGIVGLIVMGSQPGLEIIEPTRRIYKWAEEHGCLWAFDRNIAMPKNIIPFPSDSFLRELREERLDQLCDVHDDIKDLVEDIINVIPKSDALPVFYESE